MLVRELMERLQGFDPEREVVLWNSEYRNHKQISWVDEDEYIGFIDRIIVEIG